MGIETVAFLAFSAISAASQMKAAQSEAKAKVQEGTIAAQNKAKETLYNTARLQSSFLNSGLTLDGTPRSVIDAEYGQGFTDTNMIINNTNTASKNIINKGRTAALSSIAGSLDSFAMPASVSGFGSDVSFGAQSAMNGTGFGTGYDVSNSMRNNRSIF